jgi:hypothetical protein
VVDVGRGAPGPPLIPPIRGASKTGGAGGGEGGSGSLGGLPCRCHVQQCAPTVHEGQGGDGGIHLIISASSNKHHPMSQAQTKAPLADLSTQVAGTQSPTNTPKLLLDQSRSAFALHSYRTHSVPTAMVQESCSLRAHWHAIGTHRTQQSGEDPGRRHDPCRQGQAGPQWA